MKKFISFLCDLLTIKEPVILYEPTEEYPLPETAGARSYPEDNVIVLNTSLFHDDLEYILITHEIRHIYQYQVVKNNLSDLESKNTIREWRKGFKNYKDSTSLHYENQSLEVDAQTFTWYVLYVLFQKSTNITCSENAFKKRLKVLMYDLPADEIREVYDFHYTKKA